MFAILMTVSIYMQQSKRQSTWKSAPHEHMNHTHTHTRQMVSVLSVKIFLNEFVSLAKATLSSIVATRKKKINGKFKINLLLSSIARTSSHCPYGIANATRKQDKT